MVNSSKSVQLIGDDVQFELGTAVMQSDDGVTDFSSGVYSHPARDKHLLEPPLPTLDHSITVGATSPRCLMCAQSAIVVCSGCRSSRYCSVECRGRDWPVHKLLCHSFRDFLIPPLSEAKDSFARRTILFAADVAVPQFVWSNCLKNSPRHADSDVFDMLGDDESIRAMPDVKSIKYNNKQGVELDHSIDILFRDTMSIDGSLPNQSIITATQGKTAFNWYGNVVAVRLEDLGQESKLTGDLTMEDLRHIVDFFTDFTGTKKAVAVVTARKTIWTPSSPNNRTVLVNHGKKLAGGNYESPWVVES
ncbi:hypothetical protein BX600DRAFT_442551 [Xylariales sp. PMI_506]|nr:hypothetical protein BX600DRAFT_442551 [Xylariales sp. PMI_506]